MTDKSAEEKPELPLPPTSVGRDPAVGYRLGSSSTGGVLVRGTSQRQLRPGGNLELDD